MFVEIFETDDVKTKIGKILINIFVYLEIYGTHDTLPIGFRKSELKEMIIKYARKFVSEKE